MIFIKFIFPQNYNFKAKLLGVIDYSTAIFCIIWCIIILFILNLLFNSLKIIISISIITILPVFIFCLVGFNGESIITTINFIFLYVGRPKIYVFGKKS